MSQLNNENFKVTSSYEDYINEKTKPQNPILQKAEESFRSSSEKPKYKNIAELHQNI